MLVEVWRRIRVGFAVALAVVTCPCHLPLILPLVLSATAGTSVGAVISKSPTVFVLVLVALFGGSLFLTFRLQNKKSKVSACEVGEARSGSDRPVIQNAKVITGQRSF